MAIRAQGTLLKAAVGTGEVYTTVGEVLDFNGPSPTRPVIDATNLTSTARKKITGLSDYGQFTAQLHLDYGDAGQDNVRDAQASGALTNFQLLIPAGIAGSTGVATTVSFAGYVSGFSASGSVDGLITSSLTIEIDGAVTEAATV
jgi:hypothetical protein